MNEKMKITIAIVFAIIIVTIVVGLDIRSETIVVRIEQFKSDCANEGKRIEGGRFWVRCK